ncbi:MAG: hypothetical protein ACLR62_01445 [Coprococcus sp.]|jgi:hypothetical protein
MHKWAKQIMECVKAKVEAIGLDNFEGQNLDDLKDFTEIAKNIACFDKDYRIVEAMEKSEDNEDIMRMVEQYEDYPDRRFYDNYRYANGRFAPKGRGTRRGYIEPPYYHQMPDDYRTWEDKPMQERMRDLDRMSGRMHYTEPTTATRDSREGKSGMMRRSYIEAKEMHKDKDTTMQELEKYLKGVSEDITDVIGSMTPEERSMLKSKMSTLVTKL